MGRTPSARVSVTFLNEATGPANIVDAGHLALLAQQQYLVFNLYDGTSMEPVRTIRVENSLADGAEGMLPIFADAPKWSMEAFDTAREKLFERFPNPKAIYDYGLEITSEDDGT